jgi:hypothetical protein
MTTEHPRDLLHRLEARAHDLHAPLIEERAGPVDRAVLPEIVKPFPQQHGADCAQVVLDQFSQAGALLTRLILRAFQEQPARLREERLAPALAERADLRAADVIDRVAHILRDVEAVEDVERVARLLRHDLQVRLPHVAADEGEHRGPLLPEPAEEPKQCFGASMLADPQQTFPCGVDLVDERQEVRPVLLMDFIDADRANCCEIHMIPPPGDGHGNRAEHLIPAGAEDARDLLPTEALGPGGEKPHVGRRELMLAIGPGHLLNRPPHRGHATRRIM